MVSLEYLYCTRILNCFISPHMVNKIANDVFRCKHEMNLKGKTHSRNSLFSPSLCNNILSLSSQYATFQHTYDCLAIARECIQSNVQNNTIHLNTTLSTSIQIQYKIKKCINSICIYSALLPFLYMVIHSK